MSRRIPAARCRAAALLAALVLLPATLEAQARAFATVTATATVVAYVQPRISIHDLTAAQVAVTPQHALVTRQVATSANVAYALVVQRAASVDARGAIEVRDHRGAWVPLAHGARVTVFETRDQARTTHTIECRVASLAGGAAAADCPLTYELVSRDPSHHVRVTASVSPTHTQY